VHGWAQRRKTTVAQTLIRGTATAGPWFVSSLPLSQTARMPQGAESRRGLPRPAAAPGGAQCDHAVVAVLPSFRWLRRDASGLRLDRWPGGDCDCPGEACELAGDGDGDDVGRLTSALESSIAGAEPSLRLPGNRPDYPWESATARQECGSDARRQAIGPSALDEKAPGTAVAGLGGGVDPGRAVVGMALFAGFGPDAQERTLHAAEQGRPTSRCRARLGARPSPA